MDHHSHILCILSVYITNIQLLLLDQWFRSDAQEETRRHLQEATRTLHAHLHREEVFEDRLFRLQGTVQDQVQHIHSLNVKEGVGSTTLLPSPGPITTTTTASATATTTTGTSVGAGAGAGAGTGAGTGRSSSSSSDSTASYSDCGREGITDRGDITLSHAERVSRYFLLDVACVLLLCHVLPLHDVCYGYYSCFISCCVVLCCIVLCCIVLCSRFWTHIIHQVTTLGQAVCDLANSCVQHSHLNSTLHHDPHATDRSTQCKTQSKLNQIIEGELVAKIQAWLETCCNSGK